MSEETLNTFRDVSIGIATGGLSQTPIGRATGRAGLQALGLQESDSDVARRAQRKLEEERRAQLAGEAANRAAAKRRAETAGSRAGAGARSIFLGGLGFGSGNTPPAGSSRGTLFGN
jgi:hypothetical protein